MKTQLIFFKQKNLLNTNVYQPEFYRLDKEPDLKAFTFLIENRSDILMFDSIESQLEEFIKLQDPRKKYTKEELRQAIEKHLNGVPMETYGVWVFYPWSNRLVHILDEKEFVEVRTNRNQHKITIEERTRLSQIKIGVIGLSVGKTISLTMAMERTFGEIRLADFDLLELSNLNRLQTAVHGLGLSKAIISAREIAEIDPYLKTVCYTDGLTEENMDVFFTKGGKLDILVDECDGLDIKILCRQKAKALQIPVVMDMNDRGTLDVERFDLEPDRPILHGLIDHLDISRVKYLKTNEEKVPYILPMLGAETISTKLKASMLEVGESISTWPQLASAVVLGGALAADVCRRIALDQFRESGRYFVDLEELVCDKAIATNGKTTVKPVIQPLLKDEMLSIINEYGKPGTQEQIDLPAETIEKLVSAAILAPSGGNAQPWKWHYASKNLYLFHDELRSHSLMDFENIASYIGLGAASENLALKAHALNLNVEIENFPIKNDKLVSVFRFTDKVSGLSESEKNTREKLVSAIGIRLTNRNITERQPINTLLLDNLKLVAKTLPGADLTIIDDASTLTEIGNILGKIDRIRLMNKRGHNDFINEIRWTHEDAVITRDGVDIETLDVTPTELSGFQMARKWEVIEHLVKWNGGTAFEKLSRKAINASSAVGLITMPTYSNLSFYQGGRVLERVWLNANQQQICLQPMSPVIFLLARLVKGAGIELSDKERNELQIIGKQFGKIFDVKNREGIFLFRLFKGDEPKVKSLRFPIDKVLSF